jgi:hypothetical protein
MARRALIRHALMEDQFTMKKVYAALRLYDAGDVEGIKALLRAPNVERLLEHEKLVRGNRWLRPESYVINQCGRAGDRPAGR